MAMCLYVSIHSVPRWLAPLPPASLPTVARAPAGCSKTFSWAGDPRGHAVMHADAGIALAATGVTHFERNPEAPRASARLLPQEFARSQGRICLVEVVLFPGEGLAALTESRNKENVDMRGAVGSTPRGPSRTAASAFLGRPSSRSLLEFTSRVHFSIPLLQCSLIRKLL